MALLGTCLDVHSTCTSLLITFMPLPQPCSTDSPCTSLKWPSDITPFPFKLQERARVFCTTEATLPISLTSKTTNIPESGQQLLYHLDYILLFWPSYRTLNPKHDPARVVNYLNSFRVWDFILKSLLLTRSNVISALAEVCNRN